ncbi:histidine phosphatase family protein [Euzebya tangerina]|uniref:histidine phosphatase family protein n=1 Tax=Euzebya tangerina TaxID=591198 RepID=UPI000E310DF1|nr:histidine phosphatase family protein [Euzebya tangerina]
MGVVVLLRHGQASFGSEDYDDLSPLGREQSAMAGAALLSRQLRDPVVTSGTLRRQVDTAAIAADALGRRVDGPPDPRWNEYTNVGTAWQDGNHAGDAPTDVAAFQALLDAELTRWVAADEPDGWRAFQDGAVAALRDLAEQLGRGRDAVVATSGGVIAAVLGHLLGLGPDGVVALNRVTVNASLTTIVLGSRGISLLSFNDHAHFTGAAAAKRTYR